MNLTSQMTPIVHEVAALEQLVEQQRNIIADLQKEAEFATAKNELIDLVGPAIERQEAYLTVRSKPSPNMQRIVELYRQLRPTGGRNEG